MVLKEEMIEQNYKDADGERKVLQLRRIAWWDEKETVCRNSPVIILSWLHELLPIFTGTGDGSIYSLKN